MTGTDRFFQCISLNVCAAGCPNRCRHCKDGGGPPFGVLLTIGEVRWIVEQFLTVKCEEYVAPHITWYEPTAHPDWVSLLEYETELSKDDSDLAGKIDALATNGYGIARDDGYRDTLRRVRELGTESLSFSLHGLEEYHDWFVRRKGAFRDIEIAAERAAEVGLKLFFNFYLDRNNVRSFNAVWDWIVEFGETLGHEIQPWPEIPGYIANQRMREFESTLRPRLLDLEPQRSRLSNRWKMPLERYTEGDMTKRTLANSEDPSLRFLERYGSDSRAPWLWIDGSHDVWERSWNFDWEPVRHGNLKTDGFEAVLDRIHAWKPPEIPEVKELAERYGDTQSTLLHPSADSVEIKWRDRYLRNKQGR